MVKSTYVPIPEFVTTRYLRWIETIAEDIDNGESEDAIYTLNRMAQDIAQRTHRDAIVMGDDK